MGKKLVELLLTGLKNAGMGVLHLTGLRVPPDEKARIKAEQKKNKNRVIECSGCGNVMKGSKDPKSDSDEEVIYTCDNCGFTRDIRKERINPKSISQFYNENQKKQLGEFIACGIMYKCSGGKLPDKNVCKAVFVASPQIEMNLCPYCGGKLMSPGKIAEQIQELKQGDNEEQLKELDNKRDEMIQDFEKTIRTQRILPSRVLPFVVPETEVIPTFKNWIKDSSLLRPRKLREITKPEVIKGIYVPQFFIEKGQTRSTWSAMGEGSKNRVRRQPKDKDKDKEDKKGATQEMHVLLQTGYLEREYSLNNNASGGLMGDLVANIRELDGKKLVPYDPGYLQGWVYELYQKDVSKAFKNWQKKLNEGTSKDVKRRVHGNVYSKIKDDGKKSEDLHIQTEVTKQNIEHVLIPIWVSYYSHDNIWGKKRSYQFLINGYTGKITGKRPISGKRFALLCLIIFLLVSGIVWLAHSRLHNPGF